MSEVARKPRIEVKIGTRRPSVYLVPKAQADGLRKILTDYRVAERSVPADEVFAALDQKFSKTGNILAGFRLRDELTQTQLARKIGTSQSAIAAIENGKRKIGKTMAMKLAKVFRTNFKVFL